VTIFFFHRGVTGFIEKDITLLRGVGTLFVFDAARMTLGDYVHAFFAARGAHILYCWFAGRHALFPAFLAKFWAKPFVVVAGGWDAANVPEIDYGLMRPGWKKMLGQWMLRCADRILAISDSNYRDVIEHTVVPPAKVRTIALAVEIPPSVRSPQLKEELVLSVGEVTHSNLKRKGIETFVKCARYLPEKRFYLVGRIASQARRFLQDHAAPNLVTTDYLSSEDLIQLFTKAAVYVQVSYHEAFGYAVAEAMAHGCVPVVTDRFALPEVVGPCGIYVPYGDPERTAEGIREALRRLPTLSLCARERVARLFSLEARQQGLVQVIQELADEH